MINRDFRRMWTGDLISQFGDRVTELALPLIAVTTLVPRESYVDANSKLNISRSASFAAGPAVGGYLIQLLTAPVAVLFDAFSFLASAAFLARIPGRSVPVPPREEAGVRHGVRYVLRHPYLRAALGCVTTLNFFTFIAQALAVLFAGRTLGLPAGVIGLAFGLGATGGLAGAVLAPRLARRYGVGRLVVVGSILFPAPIAVMALARGPHWLEATIIAAGEALSAAGVMIFDINLNAVQTAVTADHMRSRVSGVFSTINYGSRPLGAVAGGLLGSWLGVRPTLLLAAAGGALCGLWLLPSPIPHIRALSEVGSPPEPVRPEPAHPEPAHPEPAHPGFVQNEA
jgi:predicted MFS family arabinose efflux permease